MDDQTNFEFDLFLSHSSKDWHTARSIASSLRSMGLRVWFAEWQIKRGDDAVDRVERGLEHSRVLTLCMSANAFDDEWPTLEAHTFRFRDPMNPERRFIPLRLDTVPVKETLAQLRHIDWRLERHADACRQLFEACRPPSKSRNDDIKAEGKQLKQLAIHIDPARVSVCTFNADGKYFLIGSSGGMIWLWNRIEGRWLRVFEGHRGAVRSIAWSPDQQWALSSGTDHTIRLWQIDTGKCHRIFSDNMDNVNHVAWNLNGRFALSCSDDNTIRLWRIWDQEKAKPFLGHTSSVGCVAWSSDERLAFSGSLDGTIRIWEVDTGRCLSVLEGHTGSVNCVAWSNDHRYIISGSEDCTVRLWEADTGLCVSVLHGHAHGINCLALNSDQRHLLTGSDDTAVRLWNIETAHCLSVIRGHRNSIKGVGWGEDQCHAFSGDDTGNIKEWHLAAFESGPSAHSTTRASQIQKQIQYTNAKVLLVGESGVGKTALSRMLVGQDWQPIESTIGAWATQWKLPVETCDDIEREIWLWDFGGQADQRLVHQLYMDETALAVLVFDGQKDDVFEALGQWDRALTRASRTKFLKLLVAGRVDAGSLRISRGQLETFSQERGFAALIETSARTGTGCSELKSAVLENIDWNNVPWRSSPLIFKRIKEEIVSLRDEGRILMRFNELRETLRLRLSGRDEEFGDDELRAVVGLLAGPGIVWELKFGSWILLQPERINAYAQAVIQTLREDQDERGCLAEEHVLDGNITYHSSLERLDLEEERFVLLAMHQMLIERALCLREHTDKGTLLVFPSYYRRERPELDNHPAVLVSYRFNGFLDDIYATLVVRLHHTTSFERHQLWRYAADFKALNKKQLGVKLIRRAEGAGELEVYFDPTIAIEEKIIFSKYIHEHLLQRANSVERLRHYICPHCFTPVGNREVAMKRLETWLTKKSDEPNPKNGFKIDDPTIICSECEKRVVLWDEMEQCFADPQIQARVRKLQTEAATVLDNESKERALVGEVISTVALAGQICREFNVSDHGIDMEIEFKSESGEATGQKVYLQLKSGDSYLTKRKRDGAEIFRIRKSRHIEYWQKQVFPVLLVIQNSKGAIRWMDVREYLNRERMDKRLVRQIAFDGERFDVMSVRRWRQVALRTARRDGMWNSSDGLA